MSGGTMPYTLRWHNEDNDILVAKYTGRWTWEEIFEADEIAWRMYAEANKRCDGIVDMMDSRWVPPRYVENIREVSAKTYTNLYSVVYVVQPMMRDLITTFNDSFEKLPYQIAFEDTVEAAFLRIIRSRNASRR